MPSTACSHDERLQVLLRRPGLRITLGSSSYSRKAIMEELAQQYDFTFDIATADIDERALGDRSSCPEQLVLHLGRAKADAIVARLPPPQPGSNAPHLLITCDQVVVHDGRVLEKPESAEEVGMLVALPHQLRINTCRHTQSTSRIIGRSSDAICCGACRRALS
jgi:septum formation protein